MKILVAEDERAGRKLITFMLSGDHEVLAVESADEAAYQLDNGKWDLLLTDYKMPGKSGIELIESLLSSGSTIPVILMTGQTSKDQTVEVFRDKVHKVLSKPFTKEELAAAIADVQPAVSG